MSRPLIISDCDEVILHMVAPFKVWLEATQGIDFNLTGGDFSRALRWRETGEFLGPDEIWRKLGGFFDTQMDTQTPIKGAIESLNLLTEQADLVVLTNLVDARRDKRAEQLKAHGLQAKVYTNQGPKGPAMAKIVKEYEPKVALFIDDLAQHHASVKDITPSVMRLHLCGEPMISNEIPCAHEAGNAHARIDQWDEALPWITKQLKEHAA